jgi:uncharacterized membrane protein
MEGFIILLIIVAIIIVISMRSSLSSKLDHVDHRIDELTKQIDRLRIQGIQSREEKPRTAEDIASRVEMPAAKPSIKPEEKKPEPAKPDEIRPQPVQREQPKVQPAPIPHTQNPASVPQVRVEVTKEVKKSKPGFFENNPDLEKFIGENLANKIGIAILVIGIGFFVKFAIDQNWINEIGRVFIGIVCGGILIGIAHWLRKKFAAFSSVLVGGGIAVLYFTIAIAFHQYHIFSQTAAFVLMVVITGFTILLSLGYNRVELAVFGILGGFGSPFMVSTGEGNYVVLFTYLLILNVGMIVLAYYKKWRIVNIICYFFTIIIFGGWLSTKFAAGNVSMIRGGLAFATAFYLTFFLMNIINNIRQRTTFEAMEILMLLSNTFLYYSAGMALLNSEASRDFQGLFTAILGVFNFVFAYVLYKNMKADRNLVFMLIGLVLTFISLAAPIQLHGNYITLFWAAEAVLLLWLSQKSGIALIKIASSIVMFLMVVSLLIDWKQIYIDQPDVHLTVLLNKGYIASLVAIVSLVLTYFLLKSEKEESVIRKDDYTQIIVVVLGIIVYTAHLLELRHQVLFYVDSYAVRSVIVGTYNMFFIFVLLMAGRKLRLPEEVKDAFPVFGLVAMGAYLIFYHGQIIQVRNDYLNQAGTVSGFLLHYVLVSLLIAIVILCLKRINQLPEFTASIRNVHWWLFIFFFVFISGAELDHIVLLIGYTPENGYSIVEHNHKIGFPILWGVTSFILIAIGLQRKIKMLRIISLVLLLVTLLKLFIIDLRNISEGGKIAAFISLGVLLLVVSFMYQRLKKLLLEDAPAKEI